MAMAPQINPPEYIVPRHQIALLIDGDNLRGQSWSVLIEHAQEFGHLAVARLYMDFQTLTDGGAAARSSGFEPMHVLGKRSAEGYKSMVDVALATDAMSVLYENPNITTMVIGTGDADFIPLIRHWKRRGKRVVVMANDAKLSGELRRVADELVTFKGGKQKRREAASRTKPMSPRQLREVILSVSSGTRLTDRETSQPMVRVDWLYEALTEQVKGVEEVIPDEQALMDIVRKIPELAPIDAKGRTYLLGDVEVEQPSNQGKKDVDVFAVFAEFCREILPSDKNWLSGPVVFNEGLRLLTEGAGLKLPGKRATGWFRALMEKTSGVEVRMTEGGHMEMRRR